MTKAKTVIGGKSMPSRSSDKGLSREEGSDEAAASRKNKGLCVCPRNLDLQRIVKDDQPSKVIQTQN